MKKIFLLTLSIVLLLSLSCTVQACMVVKTDSPIDNSLIQPRTLSHPITLNAGEEVEWGDPYYINNENIILNISSCTWTPQSQSIFIGYLNTTTRVAYGKTYLHGEIINRSLSTEGVPNGEYVLYIKNTGTKTITGAINYSIQDTSIG